MWKKIIEFFVPAKVEVVEVELTEKENQLSCRYTRLRNPFRIKHNPIGLAMHSLHGWAG